MASMHSIPTHPRFKNLTGQTLNGVLVLSYAGSDGKAATWLCRCPCGLEFKAIGYHLAKSAYAKCPECRKPKPMPDKRTCASCNREFPFTVEFFHRVAQQRFGLQTQCKECMNPKSRVALQAWTKDLRREVLAHYSKSLFPSCQCCGETLIEFLALDHLVGSSRADYAKHGTSAAVFANIKNTGFPKGYQCLCHSCNESLGHRGYCPHRPKATRPPARISTNARPDKAIIARQQRLLALARYSGGSMKCACCGVGHEEFLTIDHIHGGGSKHRKEIKMPIYRWLAQNDYPEGFRVLCWNCNLASGFYGKCPHSQ